MTKSLGKTGMDDVGEMEERVELLGTEASNILPDDRARRSKNTTVVMVAIMAITTIACLFLLYDRYRLISHASTILTYESPNCGETAAEARAKGCQYEPMLRAWIPADCYTPDPAAEYSPYEDRLWFYDENLTIPMSPELLRSGTDIKAWTKFFHDEHCLYAWRKLAIAVDRRLPLLDSKSMSLHHSTHCAKQIARFIMEVHTDKFVNNHTAGAPLQFETCVPLFHPAGKYRELIEY